MENEIINKIIDNEIEMKKYDSSTYYKKFKETHDINQKIPCDICGGSYSYYNKSNHLKCQKHKNALRLIEKYSQN